MHMGIKQNKRAQAALEIMVVLMILLLVTITYLYSKVWQSVEDNIDFNDVALARESVEKLKYSVNSVGLLGVGETKDIVFHIPSNTIDVRCGCPPDAEPSCNPYLIELDVLLYNPDYSGTGISELVGTVYQYATISTRTNYPIEYCQICESEKKGAQYKEGFVFTSTPSNPELAEGDAIPFCCDAGFNLHLRVQRNHLSFDQNENNLVEVLQRRYWYTEDEDWRIPF
jgi:hypothetical protein